MPFLGLTISMAVAVVDVLGRQRGMTLESCESEGGPIMRCGVNGWRQGCRQHHRDRERETENPAMDPVRHHQRLLCFFPQQNVAARA
jgi:hypothetical protein